MQIDFVRPNQRYSISVFLVIMTNSWRSYSTSSHLWMSGESVQSDVFRYVAAPRLPQKSRGFSMPPAHANCVSPSIWILIRCPLMWVPLQNLLAPKKWRKRFKQTETEIGCRYSPRQLIGTSTTQTSEASTRRILIGVEIEAGDGFALTYDEDARRRHFMDGLSTGCVHSIRSVAKVIVTTDWK